MDKLFWLHYRRKADGQDFNERLTLDGVKELLSQGGITLCGLEAISGKEGAT